MSELNEELSWLKTTAEEAAAAGRNVDVDPGYVLELFEALEKTQSERDESRADAGLAHGHAGALHARVMELRAQVTARDARIAQLEAAQRPPEGESLHLIDRAIWVDHGDGNLDCLTGPLPIWADDWAAQIVAIVNAEIEAAQRPPVDGERTKHHA
jgi:hypothetical protein